MKVDILSIDGSPSGRSIDLPDEIFGITPNEHVVYLTVKQYLANQRQGTNKTKGRSEVAGSTRKLHKQKGTGGSRKGDIKNPLYHGGGRVFGPEPRDYIMRLNKKVKVLARKSALSSKVADGSLVVIQDFTFDKPRTKDYMNILEGFGVTGKRSLIVIPQHDPNVFLSSRNIKKADCTTASDIHTYQVLNAGKIILSESAVKVISEQLQ